MERLLWLLLIAGLVQLVTRLPPLKRFLNRRRGIFIDPVCGMEVDPDHGFESRYRGRVYRFCARICLDRFNADPTRFLAPDDGDPPP